MLHREGTDFVFTPEVASIYPEGFSTYVEPPAIALPLEGVCRPGHFRGVATVVLKLSPHSGRCRILWIQGLPTIGCDQENGCRSRRADSDRSLSNGSRKRWAGDEQSQSLSKCRRSNEGFGALASSHKARMMAEQGERSIAHLESAMIAELQSAPVDAIEYARVVDAESLQDLVFLDRPAVALLAARVGGTRLIDNQRIEVH